jgi:hypothetical protein
MAQWNGQFSGLTHETKVQDLEGSLHLAVQALMAAQEAERGRKAKAVLKLANRLLWARHRLLRARISSRMPTAADRPSGGTARLELREQELQARGVDHVLREFGVPESYWSENVSREAEQERARGRG